MKSVAQKNIDFAERLLKVVEKRRELQKEETALKAYFKGAIGDQVSMEAGHVVITLNHKTRTSLDRVALQIELGDDLKKYEKSTDYVEVAVSMIGARKAAK